MACVFHYLLTPSTPAHRGAFDAVLREYRDENARLLPRIEGLDEAIKDHACASDAILGKHIDVLAKAAREYARRMTEKYDYSVPLDEMPMRHMIHSYDVKSWLEDNHDTIVHALKLAEKVTGEPSIDVKRAGAGVIEQTMGNCEVQEVFKAMIAQAQKELEPPQAGEEG